MKSETIIARAKRRYTRESLAGSAWDDLLSRAVAEYSRWNPHEATTILETSPTVTDYALEGCLLVREAYRSGGLTISGPWGSGELNKSMPSLTLIDEINADHLARRRELRWEWLAGNGVLRLTQPGGSVTVRYATVHQAEAGEYATIPEEDLDIVVDLLLYELYGDRGFEMGLEANYVAGLEREDFSDIQANVAQVRAALLERAQGKYGGTGGVIWP
jgi:hypothetical protein